MSRVLYITCGERAVDGLIESQVRAILRERANAGDHITWLAFLPAHRYFDSGRSQADEPFEYVPFPIPVRNLWMSPTFVRCLSAVSALRLITERGPWDVVHCRSYPAAYWALILIQQFADAKFVFDPRGVYPEESLVSRPSRQAHAFSSKWSDIEQRLLGSADAVICVSDRMRAHFERRLPGVSSRVTVVPCSGGARRYECPGDLPVDPGLRVCYLGSIGTWTGLDAIGAAVAHVGDRTRLQSLTLFGSCDERALTEAVARLNPTIRVAVRAIRHQSVLDELSEQDIGLLPRTMGLVNQVSWPAKLSEYLLAGLPVVTNMRDSNIADVLRGHDALILDEGGPLQGLDSVGLRDSRKRVARAGLAFNTMSLAAVSAQVGRVWES